MPTPDKKSRPEASSGAKTPASMTPEQRAKSNADLLAWVSKTKAQRDSLQQSQTKLEAEKSGLLSEQASLTTRQTSLQEQLELAKAKIAELTSQKDKLIKVGRNLQATKEKAEAEVATLKPQLERAGTRIEGMVTEIKSLEGSLAAARDENAELTKKVQSHEHFMEELTMISSDE